MTTTLKVDTLTGDCFVTCAEFDPEPCMLRADGKVVRIVLQCRNVQTCRRIERYILNRFKGGDAHDD